ncbi:dicarboxylate/amino acid:cation symporter [uncultured Treponema sp.]|uniref:dicarboxylate/amino acid:cation symporter n=1 Tax=uncultured Treponema sp. TaxID=162155 RepID=UPI0015BF0025|nr:cation:dicarboxylase symporter family transporter [uncultured Treponema sp.]
MKLWIKYLIAIALGIGAAFILPADSPAVSSLIASFSEFSVRFGRYTLLPLLFFGVSSAVFRLRSTKNLQKTAVWTLMTILGTTLILALLGLVSILLVKLPRIPITGEKMSSLPSIDIKSLVMQFFPYSGFEALQQGAFLLPCFIFAGFAGAGCTTDQNASKPVISFFESAAKLCYSIMSFFIEWLCVGMIAVSAWWMISARQVFASGTYTPLFIMLSVDFVLVIGLIYPLIVHFLCNDQHPYHVVYACITPVITAFFSGDSNLSLPVNLRHARESLGVHQPSSDVTVPLFSIFARGGSALVTTICFVMILRSYSSLGFAFFDILWIFGASVAISLVLSSLPSGGTFVALTILCTMYSRGFEAGYLLLRPAAPVFCSFAAAFDAVSAIFGSYVVAVKTKQFEHVELKHYI